MESRTGENGEGRGSQRRRTAARLLESETRVMDGPMRRLEKIDGDLTTAEKSGNPWHEWESNKSLRVSSRDSKGVEEKMEEKYSTEQKNNMCDKDRRI